MINNIFTNIVYQEFREKVNIKLLKIEDLIFNNIFIECASAFKNKKGKFECYFLKKSEGLIILTRKNLIEDYEIEDKAHFSRIAKLDFSRIEQHFKKLYAELTIRFENNSILVEYELNEEAWSEIFNSAGMTNISTKIWKKITNAKIMNTFCHLIAYSHKRCYVQVDFIQQMIDIVDIDRKNITKQLARTIDTLQNLGVEIVLNYNNTTNSTRTKYDNLEVFIKFSDEYKIEKKEKRENKFKNINNKEQIKAFEDDTEKFDRLADNTLLSADEIEEF